MCWSTKLLNKALMLLLFRPSLSHSLKSVGSDDIVHNDVAAEGTQAEVF